MDIYSAEQEGLQADIIEISQFVNFVKRNNLQTETFLLGPNECELCSSCDYAISLSFAENLIRLPFYLVKHHYYASDMMFLSLLTSVVDLSFMFNGRLHIKANIPGQYPGKVVTVFLNRFLRAFAA